MSPLQDAITTQLGKEYPNGEPTTKTFITYSKDVKKSARARWVEHFILQLKGAGFLVFEPKQNTGVIVARTIIRELEFCPGRKFRFDFAAPFKKVAIEVDGGIWQRGGGGHSHPAGIERDIEKSNLACLHGWRLLRFTDKEIRSGESIALTSKILIG